MLKIRVRYILVLLTAITLYIVWIHIGTGRTLLEIFVPNESKEKTLKKPIECNYDINDFNDIIKSITRAMDFFQFFLTDLVVDAAVGTRILQGQLQLTLQNFNLPSEIRMQLEQLLKNIKYISDQIVMHFVDVMTANDQSSAGEKRLIQNLHWIKNGSLWEMPTAGDWQEKGDLDLKRYNAEDDDTIVFSETGFSDACIGAVFNDCAVPQQCFTLFLEKRRSEYLITHAILFLLFAKKDRKYSLSVRKTENYIAGCHLQKKCFDNEEYMKKIIKLGNPNDIIASFCAKIFLEAQEIEDMDFPVDSRDLFTEQVLVCSMSGFQQFLQIPWLRTILSWQSNELLGCFERPKHDMSKTFDEIYGIKNKNKRVKRYDNVISAGSQNCSTHFTGVAIACIGIHLRYLVETCPQTFFNVD